MNTQSTALATHRGLDGTTLAWCWKVTRRDAQVFCFTSADIPLPIDGLMYEASTGFMPSAIEGKADLSVPNLEVNGLLDSESITEDDLRAGRWDGASVELFEVNYLDLSQGVMNLRTGTIGDVRVGRLTFQAELRGLAQALQQPIGELYSPSCAATLGDARCKVDLGPLTVSGALTSVDSARAFADTLRTEADDYFGAGLITWTSGLNTGLQMEVRDYTQSGGTFVLALPMPYTVHVDDTYNLVPGCRKRAILDCKTKFSNIVNFRGHPYVPGNDKVLGNAALANL